MLTICSVQVNTYLKIYQESKDKQKWMKVRLSPLCFIHRGAHKMDSAHLQKICFGWCKGAIPWVWYWQRWCCNVGGIQHGCSWAALKFRWPSCSGGSRARVSQICKYTFYILVNNHIKAHRPIQPNLSVILAYISRSSIWRRGGASTLLMRMTHPGLMWQSFLPSPTRLKWITWL